MLFSICEIAVSYAGTMAMEVDFVETNTLEPLGPNLISDRITTPLVSFTEVKK